MDPRLARPFVFGNTANFRVRHEGRLVEAHETQSHDLRILRDSDGTPTEIQLANGERFGLVLNADGWLEELSFSDGTAERFTYLEGGLVESHTDRNGFMAVCEYAPNGRVRAVTDAADGVRVYEHYTEPSALPPGALNVKEEAILFPSGGEGNVVRDVEPDGREKWMAVHDMPDGTTRFTNVFSSGRVMIGISTPARDAA